MNWLSPTPIAKSAVKFVIAMVLLTVLMTMAWGAIFPGRIYFCTDEVGFDYLSPGNWVHGTPEVVDDVRESSDRDMGQPDVILEGWTVPKIWGVWILMFSTSVALGLFTARLRWLHSPSPPPDY